MLYWYRTKSELRVNAPSSELNCNPEAALFCCGRREVINATTKRKEVQDQIVYLKPSELNDFPDHPFAVRDDDRMAETIESIATVGILSPIIVRQREAGGYEIISGHRRKHAAELAGLTNIPCIVRNVDDQKAAGSTLE